MAKKSKPRKRLKHEAAEIVENIVFKLYDYGVWQSTIFHTIILLILALTFNSVIEKKRLLPITISFTSISESRDPDLSKSVDILPSIQEEVPTSHLVIEEENIQIDSSILEGETNSKESMSPSITKDNLMEKMAQNFEPIIDDFPSEFQDISDVPTEPKIEEIKPKNKEKKKQYSSVAKRGSSRPKEEPKQPRNIFGHASLLAGQNPTPNTNGFGSVNLSNGTGIGDEEAELKEINRRLIRYGAKTGDVQIALAWNTVDDLDLHVLVNPMGSNINWTTRWGQCGGMLDIDMNAVPNFLSNQPIENIFWPPGNAPVGSEYVVGVHLFRSWTGAQQVNATLAIKVDGNIKTFPVVAQIGNRVIPVTTFRR